MRLLPIALAAAALAAFQQEQPPAFRAGVELARLDVQVTDAAGKPLRDLRQDEVEVIEDGEARPVLLFQHVEEPAESYVDIASHTVAGEVSTNQGAARGHLYVLVFDQQHILPGNEQRIRIAAQRFLQARLKPGDRAALYALPGPGPQIGFTSDARRLIAELQNVHGMAEATSTSALGTMSIHEAVEIARNNEQIIQRVMDRFQTQAAPTDARRGSDPSSFSTDMAPAALVREDARRIVANDEAQTRHVLAMLCDVLRPLRAIEGRKTIVFVSEGFYVDRVTREIEAVAAAAAESHSVVHAVDVNRRQIDITANEPTAGDQANAIHDKLTSLGGLAAETGGSLVIDAGQHPDEAFAALGDKSQDYYLVGFAPREDALKDRGAYRRVVVRVRRKGATVTTRTGFALSGAAAHMDRRQALERAMASPFPLQGLPVQYTTYVLRGTAPGLQRVLVSLNADLPLAASGRPASADVVFVVRAVPGGHVAASGQDAMRLPERPGAAGTTGVGAFQIQFELPAGDYLMRAVVREPGGLVGSADRRFTVRALDGPALEAGDLVLSTAPGNLPVRPAAYIGDGLSGFLELYARTPEQMKDARVTVDLLPVGERTGVVSATADLMEPRATRDGVTREARLALPLQGVAPGTYVARARVTTSAGTATQVTRDVEIRQGRRPATPADEPPPFDPRDIVSGALAREFASKLSATASPAAADAQRGLERLAARDYPAAIAALEASLAADPKRAPAAFFLGWAYHAAGDDRQAISAWRRAAYTDPTLVPAHLALADVFMELSQPGLAIQALRTGLAALPRSPELLERLARIEGR